MFNVQDDVYTKWRITWFGRVDQVIIFIHGLVLTQSNITSPKVAESVVCGFRSHVRTSIWKGLRRETWPSTFNVVCQYVGVYAMRLHEQVNMINMWWHLWYVLLGKESCGFLCRLSCGHCQGHFYVFYQFHKYLRALPIYSMEF